MDKSENTMPGSLERLVERRKKRVIFQFDERSRMSRAEFERTAQEEGWKLIEIETSRGTLLIPEL